MSETRLNRFLRGKLRHEYVLSTKECRLLKATMPDKRDVFSKWFEVPSRNEVYDFSYDAVSRSFEFSLVGLGVDHVDVPCVHDIDLRNRGGHSRRPVRIGYDRKHPGGGRRDPVSALD